MTESRNVIDERQRELGQIRQAHQRVPHTPRVDVTALLASAVERRAAAHQARTATGAAHQAAQIRTQTDPGPESDAACRVSRAALDAAEAAADLAAREVASYQLRVWQARTDEEADD
jgi:hypothetical protein